MVRVGDVARIIEEHYPLAYAVDGDNCGLQLGSRSDAVSSVLVALDPSPAAVARAAAKGAGLLVTHHPLFFDPLRALDEDDFVGAAALEAARKKVAVYAAHTNLDAAPGGLADRLAGLAGLADAKPFPPAAGPSAFKVVVFVPASDFTAVHRTMSKAGAGVIGSYDQCAFASRGEGYFRGLGDAHPVVGAKGRLERIGEMRLEMITPEAHLDRIIDTMRKVHPYEEPAFDIYPLKGHEGGGLGRIGSGSGSLISFARRIAKKTGATARLSGARRSRVCRVAVVPGSGGSLLRQAARLGADTLVTGEVRYHQALEAGHLGVAVVELGHDGSEMPAVDLLAGALRTSLRQGKMNVRVGTWKSPRSARAI